MKKTIKSSLLFLVTAFLLWLSLRGLPFDKLAKDWENTNFTLLFASSLIAVLSHLIRAERWKLLLNPLDYKTSLSNNFIAVMVGYFVNLAVPRGGEVSRCVSLYNTDKVPVNTSLGSVVAERVVDLLFLILFLGVSFILEFEKLIQFFTKLFNPTPENSTQPTSSITPIIIISSIVIVVLIALSYILWKKGKLDLLISKIKEFLLGLKDGVLSIFKLRQKGAFILYSGLIWFCYFYMTYLGYKAFPNTDQITLIAALLIFVAGGVAMSIPLPGGAGSYHAIVPMTLILYGIEKTQGLSFVTIFHLWQTLTIIAVGSVCLILSQIKSKHATTQGK